MTVIAMVHIATPNASDYLAQRCRQRAYRPPVRPDARCGRMPLAGNMLRADGRADAGAALAADADRLVGTINADAVGKRDGLTDALERHVDCLAVGEVSLDDRWVVE